MPLRWGDTCPLFPIILPTSSLPSAFLSHPLGAHILVTLNSWSLDKGYREWEKEKPSQLTVPGEVKDEGGSSSSGEARGQAFRPPRWKSLRGKSHTLCNVPPSIHFLSPISCFPALIHSPSPQKPLLAPSLPAFSWQPEEAQTPTLGFWLTSQLRNRDCTHVEDRDRPLFCSSVAIHFVVRVFFFLIFNFEHF